MLHLHKFCISFPTGVHHKYFSLWLQLQNHLFHSTPAILYKRGNDYLCESAKKNSRLPAGHPESFIEAFANIYTNAATTIDCKINGTTPDEFNLDFPALPNKN